MKRTIDIVGSAVLLAVSAPLIAAAALALRVTHGGPVLFRQQRSGLGGVPFTLLKLRTMSSPRPGRDGPEFDGERLHRLGRVLRATSIDELPALINVLRGEMSLVGPRPLPVAYLARYNDTQARRLHVRPGITGWAQVNGRNAVDWDERLAMDVWYVDHRSLLLDARILLRTVGTVLGRKGIAHDSAATMHEFRGSTQ